MACNRMRIILIILLLYLSINTICMGEFLSNYQFKKTIAIDLDGVLDEYTGKYDVNKIPDIRNGAKEFIIKLSKDYKLILFTTRDSKLAKEWLIKNNIDKYFSDITNTKPLAYIYLDDRALKFNGNYDDTLNAIKNYKVYWKL